VLGPVRHVADLARSAATRGSRTRMNTISPDVIVPSALPNSLAAELATSASRSG